MSSDQPVGVRACVTVCLRTERLVPQQQTTTATEPQREPASSSAHLSAFAATVAFGSTIYPRASRLKSLFSRPTKHLHSQPPISEESISRYCQGAAILPESESEYVWGNFHDQSSNSGHFRSKHHVSLQILTAISFGQGHDTFELHILRHLRRLALSTTAPTSSTSSASAETSNPSADKVLGVLDESKHCGPNGDHVCLVFKAMGPDMLAYRRLFPGLRSPLPLVRYTSRHVLLYLSYLHGTCRVIHTGQFMG